MQNLVMKTKFLYSDLMKVRDVESGELGECVEVAPIPVQNLVAAQMNVWMKKEYIKDSELQLGNFLDEDGMTVRLHEENEMENSNKLINSLEIKIFGGEAPLSVISLELRSKGLNMECFTSQYLAWVGCFVLSLN
ncbi:hypothetical protein MA16_Dca024268 [Dendrobium catenatum]|uniref:Uncharacterized protein n=1 Tax=Dendrobium catenatum TaxID=906689 RepID=A0A2I0X1A2_9ASPA|nr:hypothetical protein MA16_Dca024268 [Dendrobium catenatum]